MLDLSERRGQVVLAATAAGAVGAVWLCRRYTAAAASGGASAPAATSFDAYLKDRSVGAKPAQQQPKFAPTSFEAYLRQPAPAAAAGATAAAPAAASGPAAPPTAKPVTVLFGTEYGFSKEVAEKACEEVKEAGYWPQLLDMAELPHGLPGLADGRHQALLLVCSTQGDGVPPTEAREFCDWLASSAAPQLGGLPFSVCALGDKSYQHFCRCGRSLDSRLEALGGKRLAGRVDVNREDWVAIRGWIEGVLAGLAPLPLKTVAELGGVAEVQQDADGAHAKRWSKSRPFMGRVVAVEGLCTLTSQDDKNTIRVEIDLGDSGLQYAPGDALGVWPSNCPQAVEELLAELGADGGLLVKLPSWHYADAVLPAGATSLPLRDALSRCYDLRQPKPELLQLLQAKLQAVAAGSGVAANGHAAENGNAANGGHAANGTTNGSSKAAGGKKKGGKGKGGQQTQNGQQQQNGGSAAAHEELCSAGCVVDKLERLAALAADAAAAEAYLAPRHVVDVLRDWRLPAGAALGPAELLGTLRQLQPRLYSISSSQLEHPTRVQATVAIVRYEALGAGRLGVCSTYLGERLAEGQEVPVYIHKNPDFRLPADDATPIIMVGPGTGLAPFRSFMQDRLLRAKESGACFGQSVLYFGCRRRDQDYLYGPLLEGWAAEGALTLFTAFSREQAAKVYVQDRLAQSAELVWSLLQAGAHFYVCGDAGSMAGAVEAALLRIIEGGLGQGGSAAAQEYLDRLAAEGRYQRDVWLS